MQAQGKSGVNPRADGLQRQGSVLCVVPTPNEETPVFGVSAGDRRHAHWTEPSAWQAASGHTCWLGRRLAWDVFPFFWLPVQANWRTFFKQPATNIFLTRTLRMRNGSSLHCDLPL